MNSRPAPPDQEQRLAALDAARSILVRAPAGSGKTDLLTRRFFRLLAEVEEPGEIVAITFTNAAAAEMRHRILSELEKAAQRAAEPVPADAFSMEALAARALNHARRCGWPLLQSPALLRITTIDAFCRELALQQPMLSGLGGGLDIHPQPAELHRRAARRTLERLAETGPGSLELRQAIERLLLWRDNNWQDLENQLVSMLAQRDRWMQGFVLEDDFDEHALRLRLERPFAQAVRQHLTRLTGLFQQIPGAEQTTLALARYACSQKDDKQLRELAELDALPFPPFGADEELEAAHSTWLAVANFLLTGTGTLRKTVNVRDGFPVDRKAEIEQFKSLNAGFRAVEGFESALAAARALPPVRYSEAEWTIVRACFTLLRHAVAQLRVVFAEASAVDFTEIAQVAERTLTDPDGQPTDSAIALADGIRHLLVDEFQDTSRRQHQLLAKLIAAWPEREGRTCFVVGDPMQSIYFFRDADAELFPRVQTLGLELPDGDALHFDYTPLEANFRTAPELVERLNALFPPIFAVRDGSGIAFAGATPAREPQPDPVPRFQLHLGFEPYAAPGRAALAAHEREQTRAAQIDKIVTLIRERLEQARAANQRCRIAILGRARRDLAHLALALREAGLPFRAVDLESLADRPEIRDALVLARALANPLDRVAWLGVLRAPWCGLTLAALHALCGGDEAAAQARPISELALERLNTLPNDERAAAQRTLSTLAQARAARAAQPTLALGTWLQSVWNALGGALCVDSTARANLDLLWSTLDGLPNGELDLNAPALEATIAGLTARPDPDSDPDCGVQLMTIHKSKGLEFELVLVPELQSTAPRGSYKLLSWLERGLAEPGAAGEITEFLIAPVQNKGSERGSAKAWVDAVYHDRERQEMRRILYVAATRAREELHLFARCAYRMDKDDAAQLVAPSESLLSTAWPALQSEVRARFDAWAAHQFQPREEDEVETIAAVADNLIAFPAPSLLRRLPAEAWPPQNAAGQAATDALATASSASTEPLYARHEGQAPSRALGVAVHWLLEEFTRLRLERDWPEILKILEALTPRLTALVRAYGIDPAQAARLAAEALRLARKAAQEPVGQWLLAPHPGAQSEATWTGLLRGSLRTVRVDRLFRAGVAPMQAGDNSWWIVDYKTAWAEEGDPEAARQRLRALFAPQLDAYALMLRKLHGEHTQIRAALYYPRMQLFDWWEC